MGDSFGLAQKSNGNWTYITNDMVFSGEGADHSRKTGARTFAPSISACCGTAPAVHDIYAELLSFEESDCRGPALVAAITAGWLSIFAELIKKHGLQIPAIVYIGAQQSGKTSFATATALLKPIPGGPPLSTSGYNKKKALAAMEQCCGGSLILSDLRAESPRERGAVADLLNTVVRPVAEEPDTPGVVLVTAESDALKSKEIIPSLRERLLQVPVQFFDTKEHSTWAKSLKPRCLIGNLIFTLLPLWLKKLDEVNDLGVNTWEREFQDSYREYDTTHFTPRHQREENIRFLIMRSHQEILAEAEHQEYITAQHREQYMERVASIADWFFHRQIMLSDPLNEEALRYAIGRVSTQFRYAHPKMFCSHEKTLFPDDCGYCPRFRQYEGAGVCTKNCEIKRFDDADVLLRSGELGFVLDAHQLSAHPQYCQNDDRFAIVKRTEFLDVLDTELFSLGKQFGLELPEYKPASLERKLQQIGLLAYKIRDAEKDQFDFAFRWQTARFKSGTCKLILETPVSSLILRLPGEMPIRPFECEAVCTFWTEAKDIDIEKSIKAFRFKRQG